jgi:hypothetical protein
MLQRTFCLNGRDAANMVKTKCLPCAHPNSLTQTEFARLNPQKLLFSLKADGTRYLLCFFKIREHKLCVAVNRRLTCGLVEADDSDHVNQECLFRGTVIDTELVRLQDGRLVWLAMDMLMFNGYTLLERPYADRHDMLQQEGLDTIDTIQPQGLISIKPLLSAKDFNMHLKEHDQTPLFPTDGIIICHQDTQAVHGRQNKLWRIKDHETVDILVRKGHCFLFEHGREREIAFNFTTGAPPVDGIWECSCIYDAETEEYWLTPQLERLDKTQPNAVRVWQRCCAILQDPPQL